MVVTFHPASRSKGWGNRNSPGQFYLDWGWGVYSLRLSHIYEPQFLYLLNKTSSKGKNTCKSYLHRKLVCRPKPKLKSSTSSCNSACVRAKWLQSCPTLCNPMDCSPPNSSVHGIFHARTLEWVAMPSSRGIFPIQVLNPHLLCRLHWQMDSLPIVPPGKPIAPWFTSNHQPHGHRLFTDLTFNPALRLHGGRTAGSPIRMNN